MRKHTPGPWFVRTLERPGEVCDCFVAAPSFQKFAYDSEILGDDEYGEPNGIQRKLAAPHSHLLCSKACRKKLAS